VDLPQSLQILFQVPQGVIPINVVFLPELMNLHAGAVAENSPHLLFAEFAEPIAINRERFEGPPRQIATRLPEGAGQIFRSPESPVCPSLPPG
jgi:hypothetical protein